MSDTAGSAPTARGRALRGGRAVALLGAVLLGVAGCGGSPKPTTQTLQGVGYHFEAPAPWKATVTSSSQSAASGPVDRVEVFTFTLEHPYRLRYGTDRMQEIVFLLRGQSEYELVCQRLVSDSDEPCAQLINSFAFAGTR